MAWKKLWIAIDLERPVPSKCSGRAWCLAPESKQIVEGILGRELGPGVSWFICEHAIEIGD